MACCSEGGYTAEEQKELHVGQCSECGQDVDADGDSIENNCTYSPEVCEKCHWKPCDLSC